MMRAIRMVPVLMLGVVLLHICRDVPPEDGKLLMFGLSGIVVGIAARMMW